PLMSNIAATTIPPKEIAAPYGRSPTGWGPSGLGLVFELVVPSVAGAAGTALDAATPEPASIRPPRKTLADAAARAAMPTSGEAFRPAVSRRWISRPSAKAPPASAVTKTNSASQWLPAHTETAAKNFTSPPPASRIENSRKPMVSATAPTMAASIHSTPKGAVTTYTG